MEINILLVNVCPCSALFLTPRGGLSDPDYLWEEGRGNVFALNPASK